MLNVIRNSRGCYELHTGLYTRDAWKSLDFVIRNSNTIERDLYFHKSYKSYILNEGGSYVDVSYDGEAYIPFSCNVTDNFPCIDDFKQIVLILSFANIKDRCIRLFDSAFCKNGIAIIDEFLSERNDHRDFPNLIGTPFNPFIIAELTILFKEYEIIRIDDDDFFEKTSKIKKKIRDIYEREWKIEG